jgi:hypothetical protein
MDFGGAAALATFAVPPILARPREDACDAIPSQGFRLTRFVAYP